MECTTSIGVYTRDGIIVTGYGGKKPPATFSTEELCSSVEQEREKRLKWIEYMKSQQRSVRAAVPGRPWYDAALRTKKPYVGFENVVWPPSPATLQQLLHDKVPAIVAASTGKTAAPWVFRVPPCDVVCAVLGAEHVFEDSEGNLAIVGLPFPAVDAAGRALIGNAAVSTCGILALGDAKGSAMPPIHRRRSSIDSAEPKIWIDSATSKPWIKLPYGAVWQSPRGIVWPANANRKFWTVAWPKAVAAKVKDVQKRHREAFGLQAQMVQAHQDRVAALIKKLGLPEQPSCLDVNGKPIGAARTKDRLEEWKRLLKRKRKYNPKFIPRCPAAHFPPSTNAVVRFCPAAEHDRCPRKFGDTVATVLKSGYRAPCLVIAIERGGNESRFQAAGILACAATDEEGDV